MHVLVTGSNGYISTHVKDWLADVYPVTSISVRDEAWQNDDFTPYDVLVHVAGVVPGDHVPDDDLFRINCDLTADLAAKAKRDGIGHFIYLSSMAVYGVTIGVKGGDGMVSAGTPCRPSSPYGQSKYAAEQHLQQLADSQFQVAIIRAPSIYGPGLTAYFEQYRYLLEKLPIQPLAFTTRKRSVLFIDNLCELVRLIIHHRTAGIICPQDRQPFSTAEFVRGLARATGKPTRCSRLLGAGLLLCSNMPTVNRIWGRVAYDPQLSAVFDGQYQLYTTEKGIERTFATKQSASLTHDIR